MKRKAVYIFTGLILFGAGWFARLAAVKPINEKPLRQISDTRPFIDPLLACNINNANTYNENKALNGLLKAEIDRRKNSGEINKASVFYKNLANGEWVNVYGDDKYYPSSLGKVPILIAYYEQAESAPEILSKKILFPKNSPDLNEMQDIVPEHAILPGRTYTISELLDYMIKYSDNNATELLDNQLDPAELNKVYGDFGLPSLSHATIDTLDFITPQDVSVVFRLLYNATYLSRDDSEKVLQLLSQTSFTQGIVAGVASSTVVAHKLGLVGIAPNNVLTEHELHDCGIVYAKNPYVLCVMTRGSTNLSSLESMISHISKTIFDYVEADK